MGKYKRRKNSNKPKKKLKSKDAEEIYHDQTVDILVEKLSKENWIDSIDKHVEYYNRHGDLKGEVDVLVYSNKYNSLYYYEVKKSLKLLPKAINQTNRWINHMKNKTDCNLVGLCYTRDSGILHLRTYKQDKYKLKKY